MIFVTVGTTAFNTLVEAVDKSGINEKIIIQKSDGSYIPENYEYFEYTDKINEYYEKAELIITHGGAGTLFKLLKRGSRIIAVANEERTDKHQTDIIKKLDDENYLVWAKDLTKLTDYIKEIRVKKLNKYTQPEDNLAESILKYLKN